MTYILAIGDRCHSSWSLRAWLSFARFGIPVDVRSAVLYTPDLPALLAEEFGAARTVPALHVVDGDDDFTLWDTIAIGETLAERHPDRGLWPADPAARGLARSLAAEMHSSFAALRGACPMNLRRAYAGFEPDATTRAAQARVQSASIRARSVRVVASGSKPA